MQRIIVDKKDTVAKIVEKILENPETEIILVIPLHSILSAGGVSDFQLLKREAEAADKRISLESVDKEVLALAKKARMEAVHPLFKDEQTARSMSDIIPFGKIHKRELPVEKISGEKQSKKKKTSKITEEPLPESEKEELDDRKYEEKEMENREEAEESPYEEMKTRRIPFRKFKIPAVVTAAAVILGGAAWAGGAVFGRAEIAISFKKIPWQYQGAFLGDKIIAKIDADKRSFPLETFQQDKNVTRLFPASGKAQVNQKATGKITIYNAYGASPQILAASTRFMTPDGKIFRLDNQALVPGARTQNGKIVPSSVDTNVTADKPGEDYNIGPVERLTIPGFKGTPKYDGFYGAFLGQTSGGSVGQKPSPTEQDISSARTKTAESIKANLESGLLNNRQEGFTILPGASETKITKLAVNKTVDQSGNFSVFGEASFRALGFRESALKAILQALAEKDEPRMTFQDLKFDYAAVKPNFERGQMSFSLSAQAVLKPRFSDDELESKIGGRGVNEAKQIILALPDLSSAKISLWPFWLYYLPTDAKKIHIVVD